MNTEPMIVQSEAIVKKMEANSKSMLSKIESLHPSQQMSATNLVQYLTLRSEDIRHLQDELHIFGLSFLASSESHILRQLQTILERLGKKIPAAELSPCSYNKGHDIINTHAVQLFGDRNGSAIPYLMITFDAQFTDNYQIIKKLLEAGMNIARINCAYDNKEIWQNMIELVRTASKNTGLPCKIYMDIPGPKIRTTILGRGKLAQKVMLFEGQEITLAEHDADFDPSEVVIGCDEPGIIKQLKKGERVLFDDGMIEATIISHEDNMVRLKLLRLSGKKPQLKENKGINFPDTKLSLPPLTKYDEEILPFLCTQADLVGYSFVRSANDIEVLQKKLSQYDKKPAVILKIETAEAVKNFPSLLMQAMKEEMFGVMIARGDLAVEIGFERLSEI